MALGLFKGMTRTNALNKEEASLYDTLHVGIAFQIIVFVGVIINFMVHFEVDGGPLYID